MERKKLKTKTPNGQSHTHTHTHTHTPLPHHQRYCYLFTAQHGNGHMYPPHEKKTLPKILLPSSTLIKSPKITHILPGLKPFYLSQLKPGFHFFFPFGSLIPGFILFTGPKILKHKTPWHPLCQLIRNNVRNEIEKLGRGISLVEGNITNLFIHPTKTHFVYGTYQMWRTQQ